MFLNFFLEVFKSGPATQPLKFVLWIRKHSGAHPTSFVWNLFGWTFYCWLKTPFCLESCWSKILFVAENSVRQEPSLKELGSLCSWGCLQRPRRGRKAWPRSGGCLPRRWSEIPYMLGASEWRWQRCWICVVFLGCHECVEGGQQNKTLVKHRNA